MDLIRQYYTMDLPLQEIKSALEKVQHGDFDIHLSRHFGSQFSQFNPIIDDVNLMAKELNSMEMLRSDLIANISHEVKTPLSSILNYGTLLQQKDLSEEKRLEYAKAITEQTRRLSSLVSGILRLNRLENQNIYPNRQEYDLSEQLIECLLSFEDSWEQKSITIVNEIDDDVKVNADPELLGLIWNNLFSNAVKYCNEGGTIRVRLKEQDDQVTVTVQDDGIGMTQETVNHIFDKFYQGDTSHASEGNGLGMSMVREILNIVGGDIAISSTLREGSQFVVTVPQEMP
ncbi:MAG: HAMP domain-containing sensor histidine kinase [Acutalibacteraceae bacterium]|nr:HAMP domain-containing sensor histidine kinase [Acutalibacteraceae bacterium]